MTNDKKPNLEIDMGMIDESGCWGTFIATVAICSFFILLIVLVT